MAEPLELPVFVYDDGDAVRAVAADFTKNGGYLVVTKYAADGVMTIEQTYRVDPPDEYELAVSVERHRREAAARDQALAAWWSTVLEESAWQEDAATIAVLDLHAPDTDARSWLTCPVCDADDLDPGPWPCRTVVAIAGAYNIPTPKETT